MTRRSQLVALAGSLAAVAVVTAAIELFKGFVPVLSLGVLYVFAVVLVAALWGLRFALPVAIASMLAFNWFHLPPLHTFTLAEGSNWFALAAYLVVAVTVSLLADRVRRRAAEAEQREREAALLADVASDLLGGRELQEELDAISARAAEVLGVSRARIELGRHAPPSGEAPLPLEVDRRLVGTLYLPEGEATNIAERGRFLPALASLIGVAVDRERLEQEATEADALRRSDTVKTAVLQAVSHDLRSPLTAIRAAADGLRSEEVELDEFDRAELVETIHIEARRLDRIVSNLLELSRLQADAAPPTPELWSVDALVAQALEEVRGSDRVDVVLAHEVPPVSVDATQIQHVLANLLENALKFSRPETRVQVRVTCTRKEAIVRVVDQGPGIPENELERIFEPFHRGGDGSRGAGLGLAIARGFAEANGGRVWAESRPGQGASFALALPLVEQPAATA
jgi:two-component system, OmpR family, sensor histidine kinase KdpD